MLNAQSKDGMGVDRGEERPWGDSDSGADKGSVGVWKNISV